MFTKPSTAFDIHHLCGAPIGMPEKIFRERAAKAGFKLPPKRDFAAIRRQFGMPPPRRGATGRWSGWQAANERFQLQRKDAAAQRDYDRDCRDNADLGMPLPDPRNYFGWEDSDHGDTHPGGGKPPGPYRKDVSTHEAGHAIVADVLGVKLLKLVSYEHNNMGGACYPDLSHTPDLSILQRTAIWAAGTLAVTQLIYGHFHPRSEGDWRSLFASAVGDVKLMAKDLGVTGDPFDVFSDGRIRNGCVLASDVVYHNRDALRALAAKLEVDGELDETGIRQFFTNHPVTMPPSRPL